MPRFEGLPAPKAELYFRTKHPDWFVFHCLPSYSPELNPVEQCWNEMKNGPLSNFVADNVHVLREAALAAADKLDQRADLLFGSRSNVKYQPLSAWSTG